MKAQLLIAAIALAAPVATFADHNRSYSYVHSQDCRPSYRPYVFTPSYGYYGPGPGISIHFGSRPSTYTATRYYVPGSSSLEASVQRALRREGYYRGSLDGDLGPMSRSAIREYQADHGLYVTGRVDSRLLRSLGI